MLKVHRKLRHAPVRKREDIKKRDSDRELKRATMHRLKGK
jgi:hypothetical protein